MAAVLTHLQRATSGMPTTSQCRRRTVSVLADGLQHHRSLLMRLLKSPLAKTVVAIATVGTAVVGFVSDILGLRSEDTQAPTVITVLVETTEDSTQETTTSSTTSTSVAPATFISPQTALEELRTELSARATSGVLEVCGTRAFLLTSTELRMFEWLDDQGWKDFSALVQPPTELKPIGLVVIDVPKDGIPDILISFERLGSSEPLNGVLSVPNGAIGCGQGYSWQYFSKADGSFAQLVPRLEPSGNGFVSKELVGETNSVTYLWSSERDYFQVQSPLVSTTPETSTSTADPTVVRQFVTEYGKFTTQSFNSMLQMVEANSPAEQLTRFLLAGKQASRDAGYGEGSGFPTQPDGDNWRIFFPGLSTVLSDFRGENGKIKTFRMNEIELDKLIRFDASTLMLTRRCTNSGVCVGIRGVQLGNRTTYVAIEVDTSAMVGRVKFTNSWLTTGASRQRHISATLSLANSPRIVTWGTAYELAELPWGASLEIELSINGSAERLTLNLPS